MKTDFFQKLLFLASTKKLKTNFFKILIIFNNLSKYIKSDFFSENVIFWAKNSYQNTPLIGFTEVLVLEMPITSPNPYK